MKKEGTFTHTLTSHKIKMCEREEWIEWTLREVCDVKTEEEIKLVAPKGQTKREEGAERGHEEAFITFAFSSFTFLGDSCYFWA